MDKQQKVVPFRVQVSHTEAILDGSPLTGLVDRMANALNIGALTIDMCFPVTDGLNGNGYACEWLSAQEIKFADGSTHTGLPVDIINSALLSKEYNIGYSFGSPLRQGAIRFTVKGYEGEF